MIGRAPAFDVTQLGWRFGAASQPHGGEVFVPWDQSCGVIGPSGSGKTLDLLAPALLQAPGAAVATLTKPEDMLLTWTARERRGPCLVVDPFGLTPGLPELVWDPLMGCANPVVAERRAKAFAAGTIPGASDAGVGDDAARFYAAESAKVLQAFFHAAALSGGTLEHVLTWVAQPSKAERALEILRRHPMAARGWDGLLAGSIHGDARTAAITISSVQQAMSLFFQEELRRRCVPAPGERGTDLKDLVQRHGTAYLLGREDPYASAAPLMTALTECLLDTALHEAQTSPYGRLCPPFLACLDELPSTAPLPTLRTRMANERALGISILWAAQTYTQLQRLFERNGAKDVLGLSNVLAIFGGLKDAEFLKELSELGDVTRITRREHSGRGPGSVHFRGEDVPVFRPGEIRELAQRDVLVFARNLKPFVARLERCIEGPAGQQLKAEASQLRDRVTTARSSVATDEELTEQALAAAKTAKLLLS